MQNNKEIEIKLTFKDKKLVENRLVELGAKRLESFGLRDRYYSRTQSMSNSNQLVRIREKGARAELSFKGKAEIDKNIWTREELTTTVSDPEKTEKILLSLGIEKIKENSSERETWSIYGLDVVFINFTKPAKLFLLEIEGDPEKIRKLIGELGSLVVESGEEEFEKFDSRKQKRI
jgi:predicted adenylyl cyclase CyaB